MKFVPFLSGLLLIASAALAAEHTHDGFFLNMGLGAGSTDMDFTIDDSAYPGGTFSGMSTILDFRIGGCPVENLAVSFDMTGITMEEPDLEYDNGTSGQADATLNISSFGVGATWFEENLNAYVGGTFYFGGQENLETSSASGKIDGSLKGFALRVGKEWWVSENWGLGAQLQYNMANFESDTDIAETDEFSTLALLFSATFN